MSTAKTEEPTAQRLRELRRRGEVPYSGELVRAGALLGAVLGWSASGSTGVAALRSFAIACLGPNRPEASAGLLEGLRILASAALPLAGGAALVGCAIGLLQTGFLLAPDRILPDLARLTPGQVWTGKFRLDTLVRLALGVAVVLAGLAAMWMGVGELLSRAGSLVSVPFAHGRPLDAVRWAAGPVASVAGAWLAIAAAAAAIDALWQRKSFLDRNRMSQQEIRDEVKQSEGDPHHRAARERAHRELLRQDIRGGVARADVVLRNPTHLAIALRYRREELDAPVVTVSGRGDIAKRILREARRRGLPEYADRPTARALIDVPPGEPVPEALFEPIAVIFRWMQREGLVRSSERDGG